MRFIFIVALSGFLAACQHTENYSSTMRSETPPILVSSANYALMTTAPQGAGAPTSDCGRNVNDIITHLEQLMAQKIAAEQAAATAQAL